MHIKAHGKSNPRIRHTAARTTTWMIIHLLKAKMRLTHPPRATWIISLTRAFQPAILICLSVEARRLHLPWLPPKWRRRCKYAFTHSPLRTPSIFQPYMGTTAEGGGSGGCLPPVGSMAYRIASGMLKSGLHGDSLENICTSNRARSPARWACFYFPYGKYPFYGETAF